MVPAVVFYGIAACVTHLYGWKVWEQALHTFKSSSVHVFQKFIRSFQFANLANM